LNDEAIAVLHEEIGKHRDYVFTFRRRPLVNANTKTRKNALPRAGIDNFRSHDLRHVWATWHVMAGTTLGKLQEVGAWNPRRWSGATPTSRRSRYAKRPTDLLRLGIQRRKKLLTMRHKLLNFWCRHQESNPGPSVYKTAALPSELCRPVQACGDLRPLRGYFTTCRCLGRLRGLSSDGEGLVVEDSVGAVAASSDATGSVVTANANP